MMFLSSLMTETALQSMGEVRLSGSWIEIAQVEQKNAILSGVWAEIAQVQQKEAIITSHWVEVVYSINAPPEEEPDREPPPTPYRRRLLLGIAAVPELVDDPAPPPEPPLQIIDLSGEPVSTTAIQLFFTDLVDATSHQYRLNGGAPAPMPSDKRLTGLVEDTEYTIEVRGLNSSGPGPWSNLVTVRTWEPAIIDPNDTDGDGIPNVNDPDHPDYDPNHPDSDPDGDGLPNVTDTDDDGDGIPDVDDTDHPDYVPPPAPEPLSFSRSGSYFSGFDQSFKEPKSVITDSSLVYEGTGGTAPYTYAWALEGQATLTNLNTGQVSVTPTYAVVTNPNGGSTRFGAAVGKGMTLEHSMRCTITDSLGATTSFVVGISLSCLDLN